VKLSEEVLSTIDSRVRKPGDGYQSLRRSFQRATGQSANALFVASKHIGGIYQYRDHYGDPNGRTPLQPVPAARQRQAFELIRARLFAPTAFQFPAELLNKLVRERYNDPFAPNTPSGGTRFDVPIHSLALGLQQRVLERLMHPVVLSRILDSSVKPAPKTEPFRLSDLFQGLYDSIWAEYRSPASNLSVNSFGQAAPKGEKCTLTGFGRALRRCNRRRSFIASDHGSGAFSNHDCWRVRVAAGNYGHDGRINNPEAVNATEAQGGIHNTRIIHAHPARPHRMEAGPQ
jgi:hypothetical protein